ncbi:MAG: UDP-N-acetylmuramate dehydrogenase [Bryobacteraceae bacterium]
MSSTEETLRSLAAIPHLKVSQGALLSEHTRFGIGGPADLLVQCADPGAFAEAIRLVRASGNDFVIIGGGTNLIVSDDGFRGIVLRYTADRIESQDHRIRVDAGAVLQDLVDFSIARGLRGLETMTGIPGSVGAAIYGNAGAYGHSISERIESVRFFDGSGVRTFGHPDCDFRYRESIFKRNKEWIVFSAELAMEPADPEALRKTADEILGIRNRKYPPTMKCAGSIFKNLLIAELPETARRETPPEVVREGKVPSAWFLEQVGAKGMSSGGIRVADYHANLIYNAGGGTARQLCEVIAELKRRVRERFGFELEEEVQYVGFDGRLSSCLSPTK